MKDFKMIKEKIYRLTKKIDMTVIYTLNQLTEHYTSVAIYTVKSCV